MHSIEWALTRDYLRRGAIAIPTVLLAIVALPLWLFEALGRDGFLPGSEEGVKLHFNLCLCMGFGAAIAVFQSQGKITRFFLRPISATRIVAIEMILGMATIVVLYVVAASLVNLRGVGWPVIGPAMFLATTLACSLAAVWWFEGNILGQFLGCTAVSVPLTIWFSRCYGATIMGDWNRMWHNPTAGESLTLAAITAAAFGLAVVGVARTRRGDLWDLSGLYAWWERQMARGGAAPRFASPLSAQLWSDWNQKLGPSMACMVGFVMFIAWSAWLAGYMPTDDMLEFMVALPLVMMVFIMATVYGLIAGNFAQTSGGPMRNLLGTLPVTDSFLSAATLRNCAWALAAAWGTWVVLSVVVVGMAYLAGFHAEVRQMLPARINAGNFALFLFVPLLSWTITSLTASLIATGRPWLWASVFTGGWTLALGLAILKGFIPESTFAVIQTGWLSLSGAVYAAGTIAAFIVALRLRLISPATAISAVAVWVTASCLLAFTAPPRPFEVNIGVRHGICALALSVLPLAAMPLAIRWNRHR